MMKNCLESGKPIQNARDYLISIYLDYVNNYLTEEKWAEHNGLELSQAKKLLDIATIVRGMPHPEA